jgi:phenylpyruvate tautomerase PptA (4-oxalocrotonate tautomerase family)
MPIIDVEIVVAENEQLPSNLAAILADAMSKVFGTSTGQTWVRLRKIPLQDYAEDGGGPPQDVRPVFVTILKVKLPPMGELKHEMEQLTQVIAHSCNRPVENVHVFYQPEGKGRVAFGGRLVE